jgi:nitrate/TMAO reductase-like tetraheme cytochrome c subunit
VSEMPTRRRSRWIVAGSVAALALASSLVAASFATDRPGFCDECHEMAPYEQAWAEGPHSEVWCIECHVDAGPIARLPARGAGDRA